MRTRRGVRRPVYCVVVPTEHANASNPGGGGSGARRQHGAINPHHNVDTGVNAGVKGVAFDTFRRSILEVVPENLFGRNATGVVEVIADVFASASATLFVLCVSVAKFENVFDNLMIREV